MNMKKDPGSRTIQPRPHEEKHQAKNNLNKYCQKPAQHSKLHLQSKRRWHDQKHTYPEDA